MGRPREHDEGTRQALLEAAIHVLGTEGAGALSVRGLAEAAKVSTRAVYSLFGSKHGVLGALYEESFTRLAERLEAVPTTADPRADLIALAMNAFRPYALEHENLFRLVFERLVPDLDPTPEPPPAFRALDHLRMRVRRCQEAGLLGERKVDPVVMQFHATCQGLASVELLGWLDPIDPDVIWRDTLSTLLDGLERRPAPG